MIFTGMLGWLDRLIRGIDLTQMSGKLSPDLVDSEQASALLEGYDAKLHPHTFGLSAASPSLLTIFHVSSTAKVTTLFCFCYCPSCR